MSVTTVGYVDKVERNEDYYDIHDTLLRNTQGQANGIATLDSTGKLTTSQKPTYTATDVGLGNVDNTSDSTKKTNFTGAIEENNTGFVTGGDAYTALTGKLSTALKGANNGLAELGSDGKVPASQLPSYVDDVVEVDDYAHLPITGEAGKIYLTVNDNKQYRWTGTTYAQISSSLALGETSETAYRGDRGKTAYDHATETKLGTATSSGLYKVAATAQGHIASLTAVEKSDITALGISDTDTNDAVTQTATTTNAAYEVLFSGTADNTTRTEGARKNSNFKFNPSTGLLYSMTEVRSTSFSVSATNGTSGGISLYSSAAMVDEYGVMFRKTSNQGVHGDTTGDWATYFTMYNDTSSKRGWIFKHYNSGNVASINTVGNAVFNGSVTVGGNATNTSGATLSFNSSNNCIDVLFA